MIEATHSKAKWLKKALLFCELSPLVFPQTLYKSRKWSSRFRPTFLLLTFNQNPQNSIAPLSSNPEVPISRNLWEKPQSPNLSLLFPSPSLLLFIPLSFPSSLCSVSLLFFFSPHPFICLESATTSLAHILSIQGNSRYRTTKYNPWFWDLVREADP